jgi:hypothetical protein
MQRFGTAAIPTHSIGLALLKSDWHLAVSLILRPRPGEHPDVLAARRAWLDDGDLDRALELLPRRVVAERCILESYKKQHGETRNALGALSTVRVVTLTVAWAWRLSWITAMPTDSKEPKVDVRSCVPVICVECYRF